MLKKAFLLMIVLLLVSSVLGCAGGTITPISLVPDKADLLMNVDLSHVADNEEEIRNLFNEYPLDTEGQQMVDDLIEQLKGLQEAVLFFDTSAMDTSSYGALIVKGNFVENDLVTKMGEWADETFTTSGYKDYKLYTDSSQESVLVFLGSNGFAFGEMQAIKDVIDVKEGDLSAVSGKVLDVYNDLGDKHTLKVAMLVSPGLVSEGLGGTIGDSDIPVDLSTFEDMETLGVTVDDNEDATSILMKLCFGSSASAQDAEDFINFMLMGLSFTDLGEASEILMPILDKLEVNTVDSCLNLRIDLTEDDINTLMQGLFAISSMESSLPDFQPIR